MVNSQPGAAFSPEGELDQPTLYEFLTRLVSSPDARAAFDADPRAALDRAGLEDMTSADVLQATSLVLDYAPIEVVEEYDRSLQSSVEKFAANTQFAAFNQIHSADPHEQEVTEQTMLNSTPSQESDFSNGGDVDEQLPQPAPAPAPEEQGNTDIESNTEINDSGNLLSVHDVNIANGNANGNEIGNGVGNTLDSTVSSVDNTVTEVTDTVEHTVDTGAEFGAGAGMEVTNTLNGTVETVGEAAPADAHALPVGDLAGGLPAPSDLPVVGDVVGGPVQGVTDQLPLDAL